jgi:hypothetical protein
MVSKKKIAKKKISKVDVGWEIVLDPKHHNPL